MMFDYSEIDNDEYYNGLFDEIFYNRYNFTLSVVLTATYSLTDSDSVNYDKQFLMQFEFFLNHNNDSVTKHRTRSV